MLNRGSFSQRRVLTRLHRIVALTLGVILVLFTTAGALLLFRPDAQRAMNSDAFQIIRLPGDQPVTVVQALRAVERAQPTFQAGRVWFDGQVYRVYDTGRKHWWSVDPGSGRILGHDGAVLDGFWGFVKNLHTCLLTCPEYPGYVSWLGAKMPGLGVTVSNLCATLLGLTMLWLVLSGVRLGWAAFRRGPLVRWSRGRFARDSDLHRVIGVAIAPFLFIWAITGISFEVPVVDDLWYALTPGTRTVSPVDTPAPPQHGPDIGLEAAFRNASALIGASHTPTFALLPTRTSSVYHFRFEAAPLTYGDVTDGVRIVVHRYTGVASFEDNPPGSPAATTVWENWRFPVHSGIAVPVWWRLPWLVIGLAPLALLVTGLSAWLFRRRVARERAARRRAAGRPTDGQPG